MGAKETTAAVLKVAGEIDGEVAAIAAALALASDPKVAHYAMIAVLVTGAVGTVLQRIAKAVGVPNPVPELPPAPVLSPAPKEGQP
jgi:hypothetical protein